jgi:nucleotide-binding universal stress UspA family protein
MKLKNVKHILCAVRGVPQSRVTVSKAIDLAIEHQARLTFVHVNNADFLISAGPLLTSLPKVKKQIHSLGEFSMIVLCDRAQRRGVENVDYILREGQILPQILKTLSELNPDLLIIGKPFETEAGLFSLKETDVENFVREVEENLNIIVFSVEV